MSFTVKLGFQVTNSSRDARFCVSTGFKLEIATERWPPKSPGGGLKTVFSLFVFCIGLALKTDRTEV